MINKVVLGGIFSFPFGDAPGSRIKNLALGFKTKIDDVSIGSLFYHNDDEKQCKSGIYSENGININYSGLVSLNDINASSNVFDRVKNRFIIQKNLKKLVENIFDLLNGDENEILFLYGRSYIFLNGVIKKIKKNGYKTKIIFDIVEPPKITSSLLEFISHPFIFDSFLAYKFLLNKFDLCIFITNALSIEYKHLTKKHLIVPAVVFGEGINLKLTPNKDIMNIGYLGSFFAKDNPQLLYNFCLLLYEKKISFRLSLIGRFKNFSEGRFWMNKFKRSKFVDNISFYLNPSEEEKDKIMNNQDFLALLREESRLQELTFPTRIPESLVKGKVLILNSFGDYPLYFKHGENCIMIKGEDYDVCEFIKYKQFNNYKILQENSMDTFMRKFESSIYAKKIIDNL